MKSYIILTMTISSVVFWSVMLVAVIYANVHKEENFGKNKKSDLYGNMCAIFNVIAGFLLFELFSLAIALITKTIPINIVLHFLAWYISMWTAHRVFPHIINRLVGLFINPDE